MLPIQRIVPPLSFTVYESTDKIREKLPTVFRQIGIKIFGFNTNDDEYWIKTNTFHAFIYLKNYGIQYTEVQIKLYTGTNLELNRLATNLNKLIIPIV